MKIRLVLFQPRNCKNSRSIRLFVWRGRRRQTHCHLQERIRAVQRGTQRSQKGTDVGSQKTLQSCHERGKTLPTLPLSVIWGSTSICWTKNPLKMPPAIQRQTNSTVSSPVRIRKTNAPSNKLWPTFKPRRRKSQKKMKMKFTSFRTGCL